VVVEVLFNLLLFVVNPCVVAKDLVKINKLINFIVAIFTNNLQYLNIEFSILLYTISLIELKLPSNCAEVISLLPSSVDVVVVLKSVIFAVDSGVIKSVDIAV
jgi:hypothetical protein